MTYHYMPTKPPRPSRWGGLLSMMRSSASQAPQLAEETVIPARERTSSGGGIVASARRLVGKDVQAKNSGAMGGAGKISEWQEEAWQLNDLIGEQRFIGNTLAGRMSQAHLYVGRVNPNESPGTRPEPVPNTDIQRLLDAIGGGQAGLSQMLQRMGVNLFVAGEGWFVGIPPHLVPGTPEYARSSGAFGNILTVDRSDTGGEPDVLSLEWRMLSISEVNVDASGLAKLSLEGGETIEAPVDDLFMVRVWRPHPRNAREADSPTRASLPVLRELLGLTMHVAAQIESRLAGAGLLLISSTASAALKRAAGIPEDDPRDPLMESLIETMMTPIQDRSSAAAVVPLVLTVPDDVVDKVKHITFTTGLDSEAMSLREEAIRRLALGQDAPPELLLGSSGMNHWGAWLVQEDVVSTHLEPPLALICDALTTQYLRPMLLSMGVPEADIEEYVVWYDVDHLIVRQNRASDAKDLHAAGVISDDALRQATGFEDGDAPEETVEQKADPAVEVALSMVAKAPSLAQSPGLPALVEQLREIMGGGTATAAGAGSTAPSDGGEVGPPDTLGDPAPSGTPANPEGGAA